MDRRVSGDVSDDHPIDGKQTNKNGDEWGMVYPLVNVYLTNWKSPFSLCKSTMSMAIFNSYVKLPEGITILTTLQEMMLFCNHHRPILLFLTSS